MTDSFGVADDATFERSDAAVGALAVAAIAPTKQRNVSMQRLGVVQLRSADSKSFKPLAQPCLHLLKT